jgi:hypothetical protein
VRVLSLAWKYHPSITSGVGVACEGLNNALSKLVDLTVIYPSVSKIQVNEEIVFTSEDLSEEQKQTIFDEYVETRENGNFELAVRLDPYFVSGGHQSREVMEKVERVREDKTLKKHPRATKGYKTREKLLYDDVDIFGEYVKDKVFIYNRLVEELSGNIPFDVIHAHDWMTFLAGIHLKDRFHKPLVLHVHSLEYDRVGHKDVAWVYDIERYAMSKADVVVAGSEYTKGIIEGSYGLSGNKIKVVYNALTPAQSTNAKSNGLSKSNFRVLFAGRIDGNKGIEYFAEIARSVLGKSKNVDFIVVGRGKGDVKFDKIDGFLDVRKNFHYLGFVEREELFGLYQACDVLCMPSISEPFGLTAIEAAHMGLPVILSRKTGAAEILKDTPMADFWDIEKFSSYILSIKRNKRLRNEIITNNRLAIDGLSWESSALKIKKIYQDLFV